MIIILLCHENRIELEQSNVLFGVKENPFISPKDIADGDSLAGKLRFSSQKFIAPELVNLSILSNKE